MQCPLQRNRRAVRSALRYALGGYRGREQSGAIRPVLPNGERGAGDATIFAWVRHKLVRFLSKIGRQVRLNCGLGAVEKAGKQH